MDLTAKLWPGNWSRGERGVGLAFLAALAVGTQYCGDDSLQTADREASGAEESTRRVTRTHGVDDSGDKYVGDGKYDPSTETPQAQEAPAGMKTFYQDLDGDGFGNPEIFLFDASLDAKIERDGIAYVLEREEGFDCNDTRKDIHPKAPDFCGDNINQDCSPDGSTWATEYEGFKGLGEECDTPKSIYGSPCVGFETGINICDDSGTGIYCAAAEVIDEECDKIDTNCDGRIDEDNVCFESDITDEEKEALDEPPETDGLTGIVKIHNLIPSDGELSPIWTVSDEGNTEAKHSYGLTFENLEEGPLYGFAVHRQSFSNGNKGDGIENPARAWVDWSTVNRLWGTSAYALERCDSVTVDVDVTLRYNGGNFEAETALGYDAGFVAFSLCGANNTCVEYDRLTADSKESPDYSIYSAEHPDIDMFKRIGTQSLRNNEDGSWTAKFIPDSSDETAPQARTISTANLQGPLYLRIEGQTNAHGGSEEGFDNSQYMIIGVEDISCYLP